MLMYAGLYSEVGLSLVWLWFTKPQEFVSHVSEEKQKLSRISNITDFCDADRPLQGFCSRVETYAYARFLLVTALP